LSASNPVDAAWITSSLASLESSAGVSSSDMNQFNVALPISQAPALSALHTASSPSVLTSTGRAAHITKDQAACATAQGLLRWFAQYGSLEMRIQQLAILKQLRSDSRFFNPLLVEARKLDLIYNNTPLDHRHLLHSSAVFCLSAKEFYRSYSALTIGGGKPVFEKYFSSSAAHSTDLIIDPAFFAEML
jgi:hypothetical protein